jgi:phosphopantothenoylcysteine decarboxylase / phosphopantothenate---cysteine ligase
MPKIILGVSGGVSAYKSILLARLLQDAGYDLKIIPTPSALNFIGKATWEAISGNPVNAEVFEETHRIAHVADARSADLIIVAPATADLLQRAVAGAANDMLTATLLSTTAKVMFFPAMHSEMWEHPATKTNVDLLRSRGCIVVDPATGSLARGDEGVGRLPEPSQILGLVNSFFANPNFKTDFANQNVLVSLGGTAEAIDPVRVITNRSTGEMGAAICRAFQLRGAKVTAVIGNASAVIGHNIDVHPVVTASELERAMLQLQPDHSVIVMTAAVSDFTVNASALKMSSGSKQTLNLEPTNDVLTSLVSNKQTGQTIVGFAAQTEDVLLAAKAKIARKGCDLLVANLVSATQGFGKGPTEIHLITSSGESKSSGLIDKDQAAHLILDAITEIQDRNH